MVLTLLKSFLISFFIFQAEETPNVKIFRFDSALFFANSEFFKSSLYKLTVNPNDLKEKLKKLNKKKKKEDKEQLNIQVVRSSWFVGMCFFLFF